MHYTKRELQGVCWNILAARTRMLNPPILKQRHCLLFCIFQNAIEFCTILIFLLMILAKLLSVFISWQVLGILLYTFVDFNMLHPDSAFEVSMLWHVCLGNCFCRLASRSWQAGGLPCVKKEYRAILTFDIWWYCATYLFVWMRVLTQHATLVFDSFLLANPISGHEPAFLL